MSETLHLKIDSHLGRSPSESLLHIQGSVEEMGQREKWPDTLVFKVNLVLEELGLNILSYGGEEGRVPEVEIVLISEDDLLTIEVTDDGQPFNPLEDTAEPNVGSAIEQRSIGGLGVHLVRTLMDELYYERAEGRNYLKMVTRRE